MRPLYKTSLYATATLVAITGIFYFTLWPNSPLHSKDQTAAIGGAQPIRIGAILPLTGDAAEHGENEKRGIDLALKEINASGGVAGHPIEIIYEDDHTEAKDSASAAHKLIDIDHVSAIIGGTWSPLADAVTPITDAKHVVFVSPSALFDTLAQQSPYLFLMYPPVKNFEDAFHSILLEHPHARVAVSTANSPWGLAHIAALNSALKGTTAEYVGEAMLPGYDNNDMRAAMLRLLTLHPDIILAPLGVNDAAQMAKIREELGMKSLILGSLQFIDDYNSGLLPAELMHDIVSFIGAPSDPAFGSAYKAQYGVAPGVYSDTAYDALYLLKNTYLSTGPDATGEELAAAIHTLSPFQGASGLIDFSKQNYSSSKGTVLYTVVNGLVVEKKW